MPPTHTDEGSRGTGDPREHPDVGVLLLSQYVEPAYAMSLLETSAEGVGYLLKDRVADLEQFGTRSGASPTGAPRSTRRSSASSSGASAVTTRWSSSPRASARCSS